MAGEGASVASRRFGLSWRVGNNCFRWIAAWVVLLRASTAMAGLEPFGVRDAIGLTVLADPNPYLSGRTVQKVHWSADRTRFAVITRQADLALNCNVFRLLVFDARSVRAAIRHKQLAQPV